VRELRLPWIPIVILTIIVVLAIGANLISPHDPTRNNILIRLMPPFKDLSHPLGTDVLGKDVLSRLIFGARTSSLVTAPSMVVAILLSTTIGLVAGYAGRWMACPLPFPKGRPTAW